MCEGTTEEWLPEVLERTPGVVILDPPRKGVDPRIVRGLVDDPVPLLLYLSCNPTTLARDLKGLGEAYSIASLQGLRLLPSHPPHRNPGRPRTPETGHSRHMRTPAGRNGLEPRTTLEPGLTGTANGRDE